MEIDHQGTTFERLGHRLGQLMGDHIGVACSAITADARQLFAEERMTIDRAVTKRQREFATGRVNARRAMSRIGEPACALPSGADRAPVWPSHLSGSISHTDDACVAVVARRSRAASLGIDLEKDYPMEAGLWSTICTPAEAIHVESQDIELRGRWVTRLFSAKEAVYKWQYPLTGKVLDFQQIQIRWISAEPENRFVATLNDSPATQVPEGRCHLEAGLMVSWVFDR